MKNRLTDSSKVRLLLTLLAAILVAGSLGGCALANNILGGESCATYNQEYQNSISQQGKLFPTIPTDGAYSMAMVLSQDAVNNFFKEVSQFNSSISVSGVKLKIDTPLIMVGMSKEQMQQFPSTSWVNHEPPELRAQRFYVKVGMSGSIPLKGKVGGELFFSFPVVSRVDSAMTKTDVVAQLTKAQLVYANVSVGGSTYQTNPLIATLVNTAVDLFLKQYFSDYTLFELKSWQIGKNQVKLVPGGAPDIDPVNHTLTFGMYTNLIQSSLYSVTWSGSLPENADIGLHIHPELIRKMIGRMMTEGEVPDTLDMASASDFSTSQQLAFGDAAPVSTAAPESAAPEGGESSVDVGGSGGLGGVTGNSTFGVTMQEMNADLYPNGDYFNLGFRLWRVGGGFCGYADIIAGLNMSIDENQFKFSIDPNTIKSVGASGSGLLAAYSLNTITQTEFFQRAIAVADTTVNFNEIELTSAKSGTTEKPKMKAAKYQLKLDGNGISVYLDLLN